MFRTNAIEFFIYRDILINVINSTNLPEFEKMENSLPTLIGEKFPVIAYIDPATFFKIEALRGDISRSRFVGKIIKKSIEQ